MVQRMSGPRRHGGREREVILEFLDEAVQAGARPSGHTNAGALPAAARRVVLAHRPAPRARGQRHPVCHPRRAAQRAGRGRLG